MLPTAPELDLAGPATKESLLNYFDSDGAVKALVEHQTAVMSQKKEKAKETKVPAKPKRKKKSGTVNNPILLSPNSALKQSSNQDFVFGTSSQLVREESPTILRDLQLAIQASNQVDSDPFADSDSQGLWRAGARDTDGELMRADEVEIVDDLPSLRGLLQGPREEFVDIDDILKSSGADESAPQAPQLNSHFLQSQVASSVQLPPTDGQEHTESQSPAGASNPRPDFESLSDAQLSRQIASYGFKPVKKRQAMIALLDQCWSSKGSGTSISQSKSISTSSSMGAPKRKQQVATAEPENPPKRRGRPRKNSTTEASSTKTSIPKETSPKRPRGRPRKDAPKPVEIADSDLDDPITSASSRASSPDRDRIFSSPPAVDLSTPEEADMSLTLSPTDQQTDLFKYITKAVTSAPRSRDPSRPSWHEKMLIYDPIVLEELAAWLNAGALNSVGYDGEVSPCDVKKWCESKSVICLWRQTLKGRERKRY
ncbi:Slx4 endonuclease-domain-containing protein [Hypoxylon sp. FL1857]|nr:Slx4 endonuclease-domain-containing protein [Hypoxylon sp. FL1857]